MYSGELSALPIWSCLAVLGTYSASYIFVYSSCPAYCSEGLLNLLIICLPHLYLWVSLLLLLQMLICGCFPCSLGWCRAFHFSDIFQASAGPSSCLAQPAWSAGLSPSCYQSFEWCHWASEVRGAQPVCDALTPVICSYRTQYMYAAIVLVCSLALGLTLLKFGRWHINVNSL